jgi:hypothetical protein
MSEKERIENQLKQLEHQVAVLKECVQTIYKDGWNAALHKAAFDMETKYVGAFGKDTLSSIAIYIRSLKK